ncbi:hypothetical protein B296_00023059 [Ensete ventricosum]|uniref:Uncharacterized protein n=1 Tax=Ensete ventricosum TaxID=4639 RepID=A0A426ZU93_ENSVE|nr:hypothetical protein B296_00023059 [Ensete ventricosum]
MIDGVLVGCEKNNDKRHRTDLEISQILRGITILFSNGCHSPPLLPSSSDHRCACDGAARRWRPPCPRAATPTADAVPTEGTSTSTAPAGATNYWKPLLRVIALAGGASARKQSSYGCRACSRPPACGMLPLQAVAPCRLAVGDCPYLL